MPSRLELAEKQAEIVAAAQERVLKAAAGGASISAVHDHIKVLAVAVDKYATLTNSTTYSAGSVG